MVSKDSALKLRSVWKDRDQSVDTQNEGWAEMRTRWHSWDRQVGWAKSPGLQDPSHSKELYREGWTNKADWAEFHEQGWEPGKQGSSKQSWAETDDLNWKRLSFSELF